MLFWLFFRFTCNAVFALNVAIYRVRFFFSIPNPSGPSRDCQACFCSKVPSYWGDSRYLVDCMVMGLILPTFGWPHTGFRPLVWDPPKCLRYRRAPFIFTSTSLPIFTVQLLPKTRGHSIAIIVLKPAVDLPVITEGAGW
uniref:Putative secreted protein n=1 Tax=Anopheles marajoara TaxID=58244 RepID=A0A2M4C755_9DIPT